MTDARQGEQEGERRDDKLVREVSRSREERARAFAAYLKERLIDYQYRYRVWITSATEVGRMLGVSDVTANDWLRGKTLPRREQCLRIAHAFGLPVVEVLEAAGYPATQDDSYNTYAALMAAVEQGREREQQGGEWPQDKRDGVLSALYEAISPPFTTDASAAEWRELAALVLQQRAAPTSKAEKIAGIIDLWHREDARRQMR
jgi:transcriptional regulator with XRE-family HTH domain